MVKHLQGDLSLPGDKSISHRALMLLGIAQGTAQIKNLSNGQDVRSTLQCMQTLGAKIIQQDTQCYAVTGTASFTPPVMPLDCGNSGTTIRLLAGLLCGAGVAATLTGDESLCKRPMRRIFEPLQQMGASIQVLGAKDCAPLKISPAHKPLHGIAYTLPMASAQVKSAILLAGLFTPVQETIQVQEHLPSRDHTERMLTALGAHVQQVGNISTLLGRQPDLKAQPIAVPGDISSAAFWLVGTAILPDSRIRLRQVGLNPTRLGLLDILQTIGMPISIDNLTHSAGEPLGDLTAEAGALHGDITILPEKVPALIDEIPILTILGLFTDGIFTLRGAEELRYKESDRLGALIDILKALKIDMDAFDDGFSFQGNPDWQVPKLEVPLKTHHDHRLVMALEILNLRAAHPLPIEGKDWVAISYPGFYRTLVQLLGES